MRVGILGGGAWGQALARLVAAAGNEPYLGYRDERPPHVLPSTNEPHLVSEACDLLLVATSAALTAEAMRLARPGPGNRVVVAGRGLEPATGALLTEIVTANSGAVRVGALAGPAPVHEILHGGLCAGVVGSAFDEVCALTVSALHSTRYRVYPSRDVVGVQLAGAIVPVLATVIGVVGSLKGAGVGLHGLVLARGLEEASRFISARGGDPTTLHGLAGTGDLVAVQSRPDHPNYRAGTALAAGDRTAGPRAVATALVAQARAVDVELPLIEALVSIYDGEDPLNALARLMASAPVPERR